MASPLRPARFRALLLAFAFPLGVAACGHPASEAECEEILGRVVELELRDQHVTDPAEIARRKSETLSQGDAGLGSMQAECVGKRITDKAMACVRAAKTADEITEACLR